MLSRLSATLCTVAKLHLSAKVSEQVNRKCPPRNTILQLSYTDPKTFHLLHRGRCCDLVNQLKTHRCFCYVVTFRSRETGIVICTSAQSKTITQKCMPGFYSHSQHPQCLFQLIRSAVMVRDRDSDYTWKIFWQSKIFLRLPRQPRFMSRLVTSGWDHRDSSAFHTTIAIVVVIVIVWTGY